MPQPRGSRRGVLRTSPRRFRVSSGSLGPPFRHRPPFSSNGAQRGSASPLGDRLRPSRCPLERQPSDKTSGACSVSTNRVHEPVGLHLLRRNSSADQSILVPLEPGASLYPRTKRGSRKQGRGALSFRPRLLCTVLTPMTWPRPDGCRFCTSTREIRLRRTIGSGSPPHTETKLRDVFDKLKTKFGTVFVAGDQPASIGALPLTGARGHRLQGRLSARSGHAANRRPLSRRGGNRCEGRRGDRGRGPHHAAHRSLLTQFHPSLERGLGPRLDHSAVTWLLERYGSPARLRKGRTPHAG